MPGIDLAGRVIESSHPDWRAGDAVVLTGWGVGERHWGGHAERACVKGEWLVPVPQGWTTRQTMAVGTAGFTAMLALMALENHGLEPGAGEVLVTGAAGGVGSVAIALLAKLGHEVTASSGRPESHDYLRSLGASRVIDRAELAEPSPRPLESERFAGCIDSVGGTTLARVLGQMRYRCSVAAVGLAGGSELRTTVHSVPAARGQSAGHRFGLSAGGAAPRGLAAPRARPRPGQARDDDRGGGARWPAAPRLEILNGHIRGRLVVDPRRDPRSAVTPHRPSRPGTFSPVPVVSTGGRYARPGELRPPERTGGFGGLRPEVQAVVPETAECEAGAHGM